MVLTIGEFYGEKDICGPLESKRTNYVQKQTKTQQSLKTIDKIQNEHDKLENVAKSIEKEAANLDDKLKEAKIGRDIVYARIDTIK